MELLLTEHGGALRSAMAGVFVICVVVIAVGYLYKVMPNYDASVERDNLELTKIIKESSPVLECEEVVYVDYQSDFQIEKIVTAKDYDGTDIFNKLLVEGSINTNKKGLYTIYLTLMGSRGYIVEKKVNVLVE